MKINYRKSLAYLCIPCLGLLLWSLAPWVTGQITGHKITSERARLVGDSAPRALGRVTTPGHLLTGADGDLAISRARNRVAGRSPAYEPDAVMEADFSALSKEFLARDSLSVKEEKLKEFFPDGKGVNRSIRLTLLLASRGMDTPDVFSEVQLSNRVQAEILAHGESAVVSLSAGLAALPGAMVSERQTVIRLLSTIGTQQPELRNEVKASLLAEATRSDHSPVGALALAALLRVNPSKEWFQEVNHAFERLRPGSDLSEVVALNVVAL